MTLRHPDPFIDPTEGLNPEVNPYVVRMQRGLARGELPLSYGPDLRGRRGQWRQFMGEAMGVTPAAIYCEIGCHKGNTICDMAAAHPDKAFIGIDITFKRVVTTASKAKERNLRNVFAVLANGKALQHLFAEEELDGLVMFFPDPWAKKKRQRKNRLFNADFVQQLMPALGPGAFVWFKSDQENYVEEANQLLADQGCRPIAHPVGLLAETYATTFEKLFTKQNLPTFGSQWAKGNEERGNSAPFSAVEHVVE